MQNRILFLGTLFISAIVFGLSSCAVEKEVIEQGLPYDCRDQSLTIPEKRNYSIAVEVSHLIDSSKLGEIVNPRTVINESDTSTLVQVLVAALSITEICGADFIVESDYFYLMKVDSSGITSTAILRNGNSEFCSTNFKIQIEEILQKVRLIEETYFNKSFCIRLRVRLI